MIKEILNNEFDEVKAKEYAVVDFSATWCGPCKMLHPIMEELSNEINVSFYNVDVDKNEFLSEEMGVQNIPAVFILKNGEVLDKSVGFRSKNDLKGFIEKLIK